MTGFSTFSVVLFLLIAGYFLPMLKRKQSARVIAWVIAITTLFVSTFLTLEYSPLVRMIIIVFLQLLSMKFVVATETYSGRNKLSIFQWIAFSLGWFGMRPALFETFPSPSFSFWKLILKGMSRIIIGFGFLYLSVIVDEHNLLSALFFSQLLLLVGVSLILHFGILNLSAGCWRALGVDAPELFRAPYKSKSLKEFWGKRWNIAFSEMTALVAYRPLKTKIGVEKAMIVAFLFSGLLHEIAISFPVRSGYGLPMLYFLIHAVAIQLEAKSKFLQRIIQYKGLSHIWVMSVLILPIPLLFHRHFMEDVLIQLRTTVLQSINLL